MHILCSPSLTPPEANLGWKLALVEKGVAAPSLLDTYTEERAPVIAEMLKTSSGLFNNFAQSRASGTDRQAAWRRGGELHQFGVHCRWSSIVVDERSPEEVTPTDPYGRVHSIADIVRAGERAPDAPGLLVLGADGATARRTTLFDIFGISYHTALIFVNRSDKTDAVLSALRAYPTALLRTVFIYGNATEVRSGNQKPDVAVVDQDGNAHEGYNVWEQEFLVFIVRPDGAVGAIVRSGLDGIKRYCDGVFGTPVNPIPNSP